MPRAYGGGYGMLNRRPIYDEGELTGPEYISQGIGTAIQGYLQQKEIGRQERNTMAAQGAEALPNDPANSIRGRLGRVKRGIGDMLGTLSGHRRDGVAPAGGYPPVAVPAGVEQAAARPTGPFVPSVRGAMSSVVPGGWDATSRPGVMHPSTAGAPVAPNAPRATPASPTAPTIGSAIGADLGDVPKPYELEGATGRRYRVDPMRAERGKLAMAGAAAEQEYGRNRQHQTAEQEDQVSALVAAGMPEAEARARVKTNTVRYDETFGAQSRTRAAMSVDDRLKVEQAITARQVTIQNMKAAQAHLTQGQREELRRLQMEQERDLALMRGAETAANQAEGAVTRAATDPTSTATPEGQKAIEAAKQRAAGMRSRADSARGAVQHPRMGGVTGGASSSSGGQKSPADRYAELKALGKTRDEIVRTMKAEGYNVR